jgi:hypothetical protein
MKAYGGMDVQSHIFLTSALAGGEWSASCPGRFTPGTHWIGGWVDPRGGLDDLENRKFLTLQGLELRPLSRPARSQSLYRLRYPGSYEMSVNNFLKPGEWEHWSLVPSNKHLCEICNSPFVKLLYFCLQPVKSWRECTTDGCAWHYYMCRRDCAQHLWPIIKWFLPFSNIEYI